MVEENHAQRVGAAQSLCRRTQGGDGVASFGVGAVNRTGRGLGVGFGEKIVTTRAQFGAQFPVVFDNAVMHHIEPVSAMRMRVYIRGRAVRSPARVANAAPPVHGALFQPLLQRPQPPLGFDDVNGALRVHNGDARRIIAPVLQSPQAGEQAGDGVAFPGISSDSTHILLSPAYPAGANRRNGRALSIMGFNSRFVLRLPAYL